MKRDKKRMKLVAGGLVLLLAACVGFSHERSGLERAGGEQTPPAVAEKDECACESGRLPEVMAVVNGVQIHKREVAEPIEAQVAELKRRVAEIRSRSLQMQINSVLLESEARKRRSSAARILRQELTAKVQEPTEAEILSYYQENSGRLAGEFEAVRDPIADLLRSRRLDEAKRMLIEGLRANAEIRILSEKVTPPSNEAERALILAKVDGESITLGNIEEAMRPLIFNVQEQLYALRKSQLDLRINTALLGEEARKRNMTPQDLLRAEVAAKVKKVTAAEARKFYEANRQRIEEGSYEQLESRIIDYMQKQEQRKVEESFAARLRDDASITIFLKAPEPPAFVIATDDQPSRGRADAPVTVVEFTDYECPSCAATQQILERLAQEYGEELRIVVRDFPLEQHANARMAAEAAEAARAQGRYWEYAAVLYAEQAHLGVERLKEYASRLGLKRTEFDAALDSGRYADQIERDRWDGMRLGVNSTPTVFINGRIARDRSYESLKKAIEQALSKNADEATTAIAGQRALYRIASRLKEQD